MTPRLEDLLGTAIRARLLEEDEEDEDEDVEEGADRFLEGAARFFETTAVTTAGGIVGEQCLHMPLFPPFGPEHDLRAPAGF